MRCGIMVVAYHVRLLMTALCADEHLVIHIKDLVGRLNQLADALAVFSIKRDARAGFAAAHDF